MCRISVVRHTGPFHLHEFLVSRPSKTGRGRCRESPANPKTADVLEKLLPKLLEKPNPGDSPTEESNALPFLPTRGALTNGEEGQMKLFCSGLGNQREKQLMLRGQFRAAADQQQHRPPTANSLPRVVKSVCLTDIAPRTNTGCLASRSRQGFRLPELHLHYNTRAAIWG